ncbi:MAG: HAD-IA family hydrolase [Arenimonas sp.]
MIKPKLLLLDLDDVLVDYSHTIRCRVLAEMTGASEKYVHDAVFASGLETRSDRGEFDLDMYMNLLRSEWGLSIPGDAFIDARKQATRVRPGMLKICEQISEQVQLGVFSNNAHWLYQNASQIVPELMPLFRQRFVCSGSIGAAKPDEFSFLQCVQRLGFAPYSTLFVDDKSKNVEGAKLAGLDAFVFENEEQFISELGTRYLTIGALDAH